MKRFTVLIMAFTFAISFTIYADVQTGIDALNAKNYTKAFNEFLPEAKAGNADAQNYIGGLYLHGLGVKKNYSQAFIWYQKATKQGNYQAMGNLANMYTSGLGVKQNYKKAIILYQKLFSAGYPGAGYNLSLMYFAGKGAKQDYKRAYSCLEKAANNGFPQAQINLGTMYKLGRGIKQDNIKAYKWYYIVTQNGNKTPLVAMHELEKVMTKKQLAQAKQLATEWMKTHKEIDTAFNEIQGTSTNLAAEIKHTSQPATGNNKLTGNKPKK